MVRPFPLVHARIDALAQRTHLRSVLLGPRSPAVPEGWRDVVPDMRMASQPMKRARALFADVGGEYQERRHLNPEATGRRSKR